MIFIDLENNPPSDDWITRADTLTQSLLAAPDKAARDIIIDGNQNMWGELKDHLSKLSYGKCWYTESRNDGSHDHVDHFRPKKEAIDENKDDKGGYWWLAFDWTNYRFSGQAPNVRKRSWFHVNANKANSYGDDLDAEEFLLLDPTDIEDPDLLAFNEDGTIVPLATDRSSIEFVKAEYSIRRLNLFLESLNEGRRDAIRNASNKIKRVRHNLKLQDINPNPTRLAMIKREIRDLWSLASRKSLYSAAVKFCLNGTGEEWAIRIVKKAG